MLKRTGQRKTERTHKMLGYGQEEFDHCLEGQFEPWMNWMNRGHYDATRPTWHIDHIRSIASFEQAGITDPKVINALSNLRPLLAIDNLRKGAR